MSISGDRSGALFEAVDESVALEDAPAIEARQLT